MCIKLLAVFFGIFRVTIPVKVLRFIAVLAAMLLPAIPQATVLLSLRTPEQVGATNIWSPIGWRPALYSKSTLGLVYPSAPQACGALGLGYCALDEYGNSDQCIRLGGVCGRAAEIETPGYAVQVCVLRQQVPSPGGEASYPFYHQPSNRCFCPQGSTINQNTAWCMSDNFNL